MDKQKQIEGMVKAMGNWAYRNGMLWHEGHAKSLAEALLEDYQPKIPENAVVLTDKELKEKIDCCDVSMIHHDDDGKRYIEYEKYEDFTDRLGKRIQQLKGQLKQLRKETAEKFAERLKEELIEWLADNEDLNGKIDFGVANIEVIGVIAKDGEVISLGLIDEICEEITEDKNGETLHRD